MGKATLKEKQIYLKKVLKFLDINIKVVFKIREIKDKKEDIKGKVVEGKVYEKNKPHKFVIAIDKNCTEIMVWKKAILHEVVHILMWRFSKTMGFVDKKLDKEANDLIEKQVDEWVEFLYPIVE